MDDAQAWESERRFWLASADENASKLAPDCLMAFAPPVGILAGDSIADSLRGAPRWSTIDIADRSLERPAPELIVLAYRADARRGTEGGYSAYCTTCWRHGAHGWQIVQHQQTPIS